MREGIHPNFEKNHHHLPLRQRNGNHVHQEGHQGRNLLEVPPVLHRQAEAG